MALRRHKSTEQSAEDGWARQKVNFLSKESRGRGIVLLR
jgi:hypothetical protein